MKKYLGFKRVNSISGNVAVKFVEVDIPTIDDFSNWNLFMICDEVSNENNESIVNSRNEVKPVVNSKGTFECNVPGTARLIKNSKVGKIFIARRKYDSSRNKTSPSSVCINDTAMNNFFNACKKIYKITDVEYAIYKNTNPEEYKEWDEFLKNEYNVQLKAAISNY